MRSIDADTDFENDMLSDQALDRPGESMATGNGPAGCGFCRIGRRTVGSAMMPGSAAGVQQ